MRISDWSSDVCSSDLALGRSAQRQGQIAVYGQTVARYVLYGLDRRHIALGQQGIYICQLVQRVAGVVVNVPAARRAIIMSGHDEFAFVAFTALERDIVSGQLGLDQCIALAAGRSEGRRLGKGLLL